MMGEFYRNLHYLWGCKHIQASGGFRILKRGVHIIQYAKSGKNFCLTMPTFSETMPIKSPVYLVCVRSHEK